MDMNSEDLDSIINKFIEDNGGNNVQSSYQYPSSAVNDIFDENMPFFELDSLSHNNNGFDDNNISKPTFDDDPDLMKAKNELTCIVAQKYQHDLEYDSYNKSGQIVPDDIKKQQDQTNELYEQKQQEIENLTARKWKDFYSNPFEENIEKTRPVIPMNQETMDLLEKEHSDVSGSKANNETLYFSKNDFKKRTKKNSRNSANNRNAPDPIKGYPYNPIYLRLRCDINNQNVILPDEDYLEYYGHLISCKKTVITIVLVDTVSVYSSPLWKPEKIYEINRSKIISYEVELPLLSQNEERYGIPKTPDIYWTKLPKNSNDKDVELNNIERVFTILKTPVPEIVKMEVGRYDSIEEFINDVKYGSDFKDFIMTPKEEKFENFTENCLRYCAVHLTTTPARALDVRKFFEERGKIVFDNIYRYRNVASCFEKPIQLAVKAVKYVEDRKLESWTDMQIAMSVEFPLRTYVMNHLKNQHSTQFTNQYVTRFERQFYDQGPNLSDHQIEQLLDAYYWHALAQDEVRIDCTKLFKFYSDRGRYVKLKHSYQSSGRDTGRSQSQVNGSLRFHNANNIKKANTTTIDHSILVSRHLTVDPEGNPVASKIHPRKPKHVAKEVKDILPSKKDTKKKVNQKSLLDYSVSVTSITISGSTTTSSTKTSSVSHFFKSKKEINNDEEKAKVSKKKSSSSSSTSTTTTKTAITAATTFLNDSLKVASALQEAKIMNNKRNSSRKDVREMVLNNAEEDDDGLYCDHILEDNKVKKRRKTRKN